MDRGLGILLLLAALLLSALSPVKASAEVVNIEKSYTYTRSPFDSEESSEVIAYSKLKLIIFNSVAGRVGTISEAAVLAPGIVPVQEGRQSWDGTDYEIEASVSIDPESLFSALKALEADPLRADELREIRKREADALSQIEVIKKEDDLRQYMRYDDLVLELAAADAMERGYAAMAARSYRIAERYFSRAIELNPEDAVAYYNRGAARWLLEQFNRAIADFRKALSIRPDYERAKKSMAQAEEYFQKVSANIDYYNKAISVNPSDVGLYYERGLAHWEMGNFNEAIRDFTMVVRLSPSVEDGYINRGGVYLTVEEYNAALKDFEAAIGINPGNSSAHFNLGLVYIKLEKYEDAIRSFGRVIEINPSDVEALFNRGALYDTLGKRQKAMSDMQAAARLGHRGAQEFLAAAGEREATVKATSAKAPEPKEEPAKPEASPAPEVASAPPEEEDVEVVALEESEPEAEPEAAEEETQPAEEEAVEAVISEEPKPEAEPEAPEEAPQPPVEETVEVATLAEPEPEAETEAIEEAPKIPVKEASIETPEPLKEVEEVEKPVMDKAPVAEDTAEEMDRVPVSPSGPVYSAQAGAFTLLENADAFVVKLKKRGYPSYARVTTSRTGKTFFLVLIGRYGDKEKAEQMVVTLRETEKMDSFVTVFRQ